MKSLEDLPVYFSTTTWWTPNQIRDSLLLTLNLTRNYIDTLRTLTLEETTRRKLDINNFARCPRCYGYHGQLDNIDSLCENCETLTAPYRYDNNILS